MSQQYELGPLTASQLQLLQQPIYALTAVTKFEKVAEFKGRKGNFIKGFLLNDLRNKNGWRTTWESIKRHYEDFINKPGTYFEREPDMPDHPDGETYKRMMSNQENFRVTNIVGLELIPETHTLNYIAEILGEELTEIDFDTLLESGKINFTSPGVWPTKADVLGHMPNGRPILDVHDWKALHYSYINDPAFTKEAAKTLGTCEGLGSECMTRLAASTNLEGNESLAPLMEVPLIREKLNRIYTPCELKGFHKELTAADAEDSCVSRKLKIISNENPNMEKDQQLAVAYSYCQKTGVAELAKNLAEKKQSFDYFVSIVDSRCSTKTILQY